jgi:hypothetical protein
VILFDSQYFNMTTQYQPLHEEAYEGVSSDLPTVQAHDEETKPEIKVLQLKPEFLLLSQEEAKQRKMEHDWDHSKGSGAFESVFVLTGVTGRNGQAFASPDKIQLHHEMNTEMIKLSVASKDDVWGLNVGGRLFKLVYTKYSGSRWSYFKVASDMRFIDFSVTPKGHIFAINASDRHVYRLKERIQSQDLTGVVYEDDPITQAYEGHVFEPMFSGDLQRLTSVTAASHKLIYALDEQGQVLFLEMQRFSNKIVGWAKHSDQSHPLKKITVGGPHMFRSVELWGLTSFHQPMRYDKNTSSWKLFENQSLTDISITLDNAVYGIRKEDNRLVKWNGNDTFTLQDRAGNGSYSPGSSTELELLAALKESQYVWATEKRSHKLMRMVV